MLTRIEPTLIGGTEPNGKSQLAMQNHHDEDFDKDQFSTFAEEQDPRLLVEFFDFLIHNKKWWLTPIILVLLLMGLLILFSASPLAPFIYPVF